MSLNESIYKEINKIHDLKIKIKKLNHQQWSMTIYYILRKTNIQKLLLNGPLINGSCLIDDKNINEI